VKHIEVKGSSKKGFLWFCAEATLDMIISELGVNMA